MVPMPSLSINEEVHLMVQELRRFFSFAQLEGLARQTGFIQRKGKLAAQDFISLCSFSNQDLSIDSLTSLCSQLDASRNVSLSSEGLNQRFNESGVDFLRKLFSTLLRKKLASSTTIPCDLDRYFKRKPNESRGCCVSF